MALGARKAVDPLEGSGVTRHQKIALSLLGWLMAGVSGAFVAGGQDGLIIGAVLLGSGLGLLGVVLFLNRTAHGEQGD